VTESLVFQSGIYVTVRVPDARGDFQPLFGYPEGAKTTAWTQSTRMVAIPANVQFVVIDVSWWRTDAFPNATGTIWLDDVSLR
jgi:hypothetical protein